MRLIDADALIQSLEKKHAHWHELVPEENKEIEFAHQYAVNVIRNAPSAEPTGDLISREDAIKAVAIAVLDDRDELEAIKALPSADAKPTVIQSKTLFPTKDFMEWAKRIKEVNPNAVVIPCDAEVVSAEADWIPCSERVPKDLEPVNATWVNHNPPCYYMDIMNVPFTGTCVRYKGKWYWWDSTICDVLEEYGEQYAVEPINKYIEVIAWMPLPEPYKEVDDEN